MPNRLTIKTQKARTQSGNLLLIEDDPNVREALELLFVGEGYQTTTAGNGIEVAEHVQRGMPNPDVIIADYNLPGDQTGLEIITDLRKALNRQIPAIVLTGDIANEILRKVVTEGCAYLRKPVNVGQLMARVEDFVMASKALLSQHLFARSAAPVALNKPRPIVFIVDDDVPLLESMRDVLQQQGHTVEIHTNAQSFLAAYTPDRKGCLVVDSVMPGMSGLELLKQLKAEHRELPSIVVTGYGDIAMAIQAMKAGAVDFIEKSGQHDELLASISRALAQVSTVAKRTDAQEAAAASIAALTPREREVMDLVVMGQPNKEIAASLSISQRTVETHRAAVMKRTGAASLPDLIRLVMRAA